MRIFQGSYETNPIWRVDQHTNGGVYGKRAVLSSTEMQQVEFRFVSSNDSADPDDPYLLTRTETQSEMKTWWSKYLQREVLSLCYKVGSTLPVADQQRCCAV